MVEIERKLRRCKDYWHKLQDGLALVRKEEKKKEINTFEQWRNGKMAYAAWLAEEITLGPQS